MKQRIITKYLNEIFEAKAEGTAHWFGYYNYDTLNCDGTKILCNKRNTERASISANDTVELGYYDLNTKEWFHISETGAFNWQQGAMAQWLPGVDNENKVIFNCVQDGHLKSCIYDIRTKENKIIDWAIYGITPDGRKSIALDLERSYWCRAYHYSSVVKLEKDGRVLEGDGIFEIDLVKNTRRLLIDIEDIIALDPDANFNQMKHWVEHIMISPCGKRFCFLHRFSPVDNVNSYQTRLLIADINGSNLQVIPNWRRYLWSHFGWQQDDAFVIYSRKKLLMGRSNKQATSVVKTKSLSYHAKRLVIEIIKMLIPRKLKANAQLAGYQHYIVNQDGKFILDDTWGGYVFGVDGHPSFTKDGKYMLTDSYPDEHNMRRYIIYNTQNKKSIIVAQMPENKQQGNAACDLHPKLSRDNKYVGFDNTSLGKHTLLLLKINWNLVKSKIG